jgi:aryl-alcohol dehydrogenase-like predicted oxidoreductase
VQFGLDYGFDRQEQTPFDEVTQILEFAKNHGIEVIDTAPIYGTSESVLGDALHEIDSPFKVVTKTPHFHSDSILSADMTKFITSFQNSLCQLRRESVYALLVHRAEDLLKENGSELYEHLLQLQSENKIEKIGVSVYDQLQIDQLLERYKLDIIQLPVNVFDQRLLEKGYFQMLKSQDIEIHVRSIFLQGFLLKKASELPFQYEMYRPHIAKYQKQLHENGMTLLEGAVQFIKTIPEIDHILVGVNNLSQFQQIHQVFVSKQNQMFDFQPFSLNHAEQLIDPRKW